MKKLVALTAAALAAASFTTPALAGDPASRTVAYGDLNLSSPAGVDVFNRRVRAAAKIVCGDGPGVRSLAETIWVGRCIDETADDYRLRLQAEARSPSAG
jgi:UrcA family protein